MISIKFDMNRSCMMFDVTRGEAHVGAGLMSVVITSTPISHLHINGRARAGTIDCFITRLNTCRMSELVYRRLHARLMADGPRDSYS